MAGGRAGAASSLLSGEYGSGGCIWGGVGSVAGGGEGTVRPCLGRCGCGACGWWPVSVVSEGAGCVWSCSTSKRALSSGGEEGMWAVGGYGV